MRETKGSLLLRNCTMQCVLQSWTEVLMLGTRDDVAIWCCRR